MSEENVEVVRRFYRDLEIAVEELIDAGDERVVAVFNVAPVARGAVLRSSSASIP